VASKHATPLGPIGAAAVGVAGLIVLGTRKRRRRRRFS
jgi:hypothetical protein